jgi:acetyl/propionyl-CoA carboxylase alpha subunit
MHYDSMLGKLIVHGMDREDARARMLRALDEYQIDGIRTTIPFHKRLLSSDTFIRADFDTETVEREFRIIREARPEHEAIAILSAVIHVHERAARPAPRTGQTPGSPWKYLGRPGGREP